MTQKIQHKIIMADNYITLKLDGELVPDSLPAFQEEQEKLVSSTHHLVVQCESLSAIAPHWVRALAGVAVALKKLNKKVRFIHVNHKVETFFREQGMDSTFPIAKSLRDALVDMELVAKKAIDTDFINPFLMASMKVLDVQAKTKAIPGKIYLKNPGEKFSGDISGVIGLVSDAFNGSVVISFPEKTFLQVVSRMFGETFTEITKENEDGAAELTNIIFGQAKIILNEKGYGINTALPSVITGKDHSVASTVKGATVVVPFESDAGKFFIEISTSL